MPEHVTVLREIHHRREECARTVPAHGAAVL